MYIVHLLHFLTKTKSKYYSLISILDIWNAKKKNSFFTSNRVYENKGKMFMLQQKSSVKIKIVLTEFVCVLRIFQALFSYGTWNCPVLTLRNVCSTLFQDVLLLETFFSNFMNLTSAWSVKVGIIILHLKTLLSKLFDTFLGRREIRINDLSNVCIAR